MPDPPSAFGDVALGRRGPQGVKSLRPLVEGALVALRVTDTNRRWWVLVAMTGALSMIMLDTTVVTVALPSIQNDLGLTQTELQWVVNAYLLALAALVPLAGRLADMFDRVKVFNLGVVIFAVSSATCALAIDETSLIVSRAAEGVGAALMIPASQTLVLNAFDIRSRGKAMGVYAGVSLVFLSLGPLIGGAFTEITWRLVFWINLPVAAATIVLGVIARPDGKVARGQRLDWPGTLTIVPGLCLLVLGLMQATTWGWGSVATIGSLTAGAALLVGFVVIELRVGNPLLQLRLFRGRNFTGDALVLFFIQFALMGLTVFGAIYVQDLLGFSPVEAGLSLLPLTIPILIVAPMAGRLYDQIGPKWLATIGCGLAGGGILWSGAFLHEFAYPWLVPGYLMLGVGIGLVMSPTNTDAMNATTASLRGQASGAIQAVRQVGGTVGLAILATIVASVESNRIIGAVEGLGGSEAQADQLSGVLAQDAGEQAGAVSQFPASEQQALLESIRDSIADGIAASYFVAGGILIATGVMALLVLRHVRFADEEADEEPPSPASVAGGADPA